METIKVTINGKECMAQKGEFLLDVARRNGIGIPHLCHHESLRGQASCRICIVEIAEGGKKKIVTSCIFPVTKDITVETNTEEIKKMRRTLLSLLKAEAPDNDKITQMTKAYGVGDFSRFEMNTGNDCVMCGLCVKACEELGCGAISAVNRGTTKKISTPYEEPSKDCIGCGSCSYVCPTGCIKTEEADGIRRIWGKEFELMKCGSCGKYFMTKEQYEHAVKKLGVSEHEQPVCDSCKQKRYAEKMAGIYKL